MKDLLQGGDLDGVAERRPRPVSLDVVDALRPHARDGERLRDDGRLPIYARRREADLGRTVVVDGRAADDGVDVVAVGQGVGVALQDHHADAVPEDRPARRGVERAAVAVGRVVAAGDVEVALPLPLRDDAHAPGQSHVALAVEEALAGEVDRHQRGRAGGLHADARPAQVQLVGDERGQIVLVVAEQEQEAADVARRAEARVEVVEEVVAEARSDEDARRAARRVRGVARALKRLPSAFEHKPLLRVRDLCLPRVEAEEGGIEQLDAVERRPGPHVVGARQQRGFDARRQQFLLGEETDGLHAVA